MTTLELIKGLCLTIGSAVILLAWLNAYLSRNDEDDQESESQEFEEDERIDLLTLERQDHSMETSQYLAESRKRYPRGVRRKS